MLTYLILSLFFLALIYQTFVYPFFLSPLRRIPSANFLARFTSLWILFVRYRERENRTVHAAHLKCGPVVLLSPREISVNCVDGGLRSVYAGNFEKDPYYSFFANFGAKNMFSSIYHGEHSVRKRMVSHVYSKSFIQGSEAMRGISRVILYERLLPLLGSRAEEGKGTDVYTMFNAVTMDSITAWIFGMKCSTRWLIDLDPEQGAWKRWLDMYWLRVSYRYWEQDVPNFTEWVRRFGVKLVPDGVKKGDEEIEEWILGACEKALGVLRQADSGGEVRPEEVPTVYSKLRAELEKEHDGKNGENGYRKDFGNESLSRESSLQLSIASELWDHTAAGFDTSGILLTFAAWELSRHPEIQDRLRKELLTLSPPLTAASTPSVPHPQDVDALPLLHAVVMETLRLHPSIPGAQPRMTPHSSCTLGKYAGIPGGMRVNAQAYSLHRNEEAFPKAEEWIPDRWLGKVPGETEKKERWFWAFGSGGRMCVGSNFAMNSNKFILAAIYSNFRTLIIDDAGIEQMDGYTTPPVGRRLILKFEEI